MRIWFVAIFLFGCSVEPADTTQTQSAICANYLSCLAVARFDQLAANLPVYGPQGSCWSADNKLAASCTQACTSQLMNLQSDYPAECGADLATGPIVRIDLMMKPFDLAQP